MSSQVLSAGLPDDQAGLKQIITNTIADYLRDPTQFPEEFKSWLPNWMETSPFTLPIAQVIGFSQYEVQYAQSFNSYSTTSTTPGLPTTTIGWPTLSNLATGTWIFFFGAQLGNSSATTYSNMSVLPTGIGLGATDSNLTALNFGTAFNSVASTGSIKYTASATNNGLVLALWTGAGATTANATHPWLVAFRASS